MRGFASQAGCYGHGGNTSTGSNVGIIASDTVFHFMKEQTSESNPNSKGKWENRGKSRLQKPQQRQEMTPLKKKEGFLFSDSRRSLVRGGHLLFSVVFFF